MANEVFKIPEIISGFNAYLKGNRLVGVTGEVTLPDLEPITETIKLAGMLGEWDTSAPGEYGAMEMEIPFSNLYEDVFVILDALSTNQITLRGSMQFYDAGTGKTSQKGVKIVVSGRQKGATLGVFSTGKPMNSTGKIEVLYLKIEIAGKIMLELDKINGIYIVNGVDQREEIRRNI